MVKGQQTNVLIKPQKEKTTTPPMYQVLLLNDDYTPMDFVVTVLQIFFSKAEEQAGIIMLNVHHQGKGVCGTYTKDIAATKVALVAQYCVVHQHPLKCIMEPI